MSISIFIREDAADEAGQVGFYFTGKKKKWRRCSDWKAEWIRTKQLGPKLPEKVMTDQGPRFPLGIGLKMGPEYKVENGL